MLQKRIYVVYVYTLKNKLLVAMPNMADPYFSKSVIFICEYNKNGAIGFIINKPISTMKVLSPGIKDKFFKDLISQSKKIYFGGPVSIHEACVLSNENIEDVVFDTNETVKLSNDFELIKNILFDDKEFKNTKLLFGHSSWEKNQLDNEIKNGDWLVHDSLENLFEKNPKTLWQNLIKRFGFDKFKMTGVSGVS
tara:strand:- start:1181 stop:1762 length:582 start_codon:yes stop_codon:yes gene_type:complete